MSLQSAADVPLLISSPNSSSERRISPSWSIAHLKTRLEPITGVPASSQQLSLRVGSQDAVPITAQDEEQARLAQFPLQPYAEIIVSVTISIPFSRQQPFPRRVVFLAQRKATTFPVAISRLSSLNCILFPRVLVRVSPWLSFVASVVN
jgi:hypothetical protein